MQIRGASSTYNNSIEKEPRGGEEYRLVKEAGNQHVGFSTAAWSVGGDKITTVSLIILSIFLIG